MQRTTNPYASQHAFGQIDFDQTLIEKYNRQAPRYTSYPTALEFTPIAHGVEADILRQKDPNIALSLYLHIPFCRHLCYYCGCNKIITKKNADAGNYLNDLFAEILHKKSLLAGNPIVKQVHLGGGTPTFLSNEELVKLWQFLQAHFVFDKDGDYSVEIDPRELRPNTLKTLKSAGVNRLSFGVQDLDSTVQIAVNRVQPEALIQHVMSEAQSLGFDSINIDLIYGLPHQTPNSLAKTVEKIITLAPDRLSMFNYAHLPERFVAQKRIQEAHLPSPHDKLIMLQNTIGALMQAGYQYIGIDHFAKPTDSLAIAQRAGKLHRNFQGYTTLGECDLLGFGVSSISQIGNHILQNHSDLNHHQTLIHSQQLPAVKHIAITPADRLRGDIIMNLLCHDRLDFADIYQRFGVDCQRTFVKELAQLQQMSTDGLLTIDDKGVQILPKGRILGRNIAAVFDEYLDKKQHNRFSKTI